ncbi:MAG: hypothetical protein IJ343_15635, partial [Clostridia bacterium]|nr:hypothetical protein [Clostridia bacterium]
VPDIEIFAELGRRMGYGEYFPEETTGLDYIRMMIGEHCDMDEAVSPKGPMRFSEEWCPRVPYSDYKFDTPSGKIELFSNMMDQRGKEFAGDYCPVPHFLEPDESIMGTPELAKKYPINVISQHPSFRTHSQYYNLPWIQEVEGPAKIYINEEDAAQRGSKDGDLVRVFNDRGELVNIVARVTRRVKPNVAEMSSGMWVKLGGSVNKLTSLSVGGPRDISENGGIMYAYHPLLDGNTGAYFNTLIDIQKM